MVAASVPFSISIFYSGAERAISFLVRLISVRVSNGIQFSPSPDDDDGDDDDDCIVIVVDVIVVGTMKCGRDRLSYELALVYM